MQIVRFSSMVPGTALEIVWEWNNSIYCATGAYFEIIHCFVWTFYMHKLVFWGSKVLKCQFMNIYQPGVRCRFWLNLSSDLTLHKSCLNVWLKSKIRLKSETAPRPGVRCCSWLFLMAGLVYGVWGRKGSFVLWLRYVHNGCKERTGIGK